MYVDDNDTVYVANCGSNRIDQWMSGKTTASVVVGVNDAGDQKLNGPMDVIFDKSSDSLIISDSNNKRVVRWSRQNCTWETIISGIGCRGLAMDNNGYLYASDTDNHEVRRWRIGDTKGTLVAGGKGKGKRLDQLDQPTYIYVDEDYSVYVAEKANHRVTKWVQNAQQGIVVAGGQGQGNSLSQLNSPYGVIVDRLGTVYVSDLGNHRVVRWVKDAREGGVVVGANGNGEQPNQLNQPVGLSFDGALNLYVVDHSNHRVQKFLLNSITS